MLYSQWYLKYVQIITGITELFKSFRWKSNVSNKKKETRFKVYDLDSIIFGPLFPQQK